MFYTKEIVFGKTSKVKLKFFARKQKKYGKYF